MVVTLPTKILATTSIYKYYCIAVSPSASLAVAFVTLKDCYWAQLRAVMYARLVSLRQSRHVSTVVPQDHVSDHLLVIGRSESYNDIGSDDNLSV